MSGEKVLPELLAANLVRQLFGCGGKRLRLALLERLRPVGPRLAPEIFPQRHEKRVAVKPIRLIPAKRRKIFIFLRFLEVAPRLFQMLFLECPGALKIDEGRRAVRHDLQIAR